MHRLAFDDLRLFGRLAALGTLSAVARERDVPVSQVSRALTRIESLCGARLVHRRTQGLTLTAEGQAFLAHCQRLGAGFDELEGAFATQATGQVSGQVRVAASSVVAQYLLLPSLPSLSQRHPQLRVALLASDRLADLARDGIDIALRTGDLLPEAMVARRLGTLARSLYAAPAYAREHGLPRHPDELAQHRLIGNCAAPTMNHWPFIIDGQPQLRGVDGHWQADDTGLIAAMVLQGLGIGRLSTVVATPLLRQGLLLPVLADWVDRQPVAIHALVAATRQRLPRIRACLDHWVDWFAQADSLG
ncbi:MAG: LysR family transcriptional regulator [Burkholderiaceae bacterium]|nr:LysR family transcriptional regulator [Burkholderiaceae bacterium]